MGRVLGKSSASAPMLGKSSASIPMSVSSHSAPSEGSTGSELADVAPDVPARMGFIFACKL